MPNCTTGPSSCGANSNAVTAPELSPPPRIAQNGSGCSSLAARGSRASAVTTSAEIGLPMLRPSWRVSQPMPPPSVSPPDTGVADQPGGHGQPVRLGGRVQISQQRPPARNCSIPPSAACVITIPLQAAG